MDRHTREAITKYMVKCIVFKCIHASVCMDYSQPSSCVRKALASQSSTKVKTDIGEYMKQCYSPVGVICQISKSLI